MPAWILLFFLTFLSSVHAAFIGLTCNAAKTICVEQVSSGSVCFRSNISTSGWACEPPFYLPLQTHLNQGYSVAYYNPSGSFLGDWNYSLSTSTNDTIYTCMSARVNLTSSRYVTLCAQAIGNNNWQGGGCEVDLAPANPIDGCYSGPSTTTSIISSSVSSSSLTSTTTQNGTITTSNSQNIPEIVGGVVGGILGLGLLSILAFFLFRKKGTVRLEDSNLDVQMPMWSPSTTDTFVPSPGPPSEFRLSDPDDPTSYPPKDPNKSYQMPQNTGKGSYYSGVPELWTN